MRREGVRHRAGERMSDIGTEKEREIQAYSTADGKIGVKAMHTHTRKDTQLFYSNL